MGELLPQVARGPGIRRPLGDRIPASTCGQSPGRLSLAGYFPAEPASVSPADRVVLLESIIVNRFLPAIPAGALSRYRRALRARRAAASLASRAARIASPLPASLSTDVIYWPAPFKPGWLAMETLLACTMSRRELQDGSVAAGWAGFLGRAIIGPTRSCRRACHACQ